MVPRDAAADAPALFLDRDGVLNAAPPRGEYVTSWEQFRLLEGAAEGIRIARARGYRIVVVTNQRCIALGRVRRETMDEIHDRMARLLASRGALLDRVYVCPHDTGEGCLCRKPGIGMLVRARDELGVDLTGSVLATDAYQDVLAGHRAGLRACALIGDAWDAGPRWAAFASTPAFPTLREAVLYLTGEPKPCMS